MNWALKQGKQSFRTHLFRYDAGVDSGAVVGEQLLRHQHLGRLPFTPPDMNSRLTDAGSVLFSTWATTCDYKTPSSIRFLLKYGWRNGRWVAASIKEHRRSMKVRHLSPAVGFHLAYGAGTLSGLAKPPG